MKVRGEEMAEMGKPRASYEGDKCVAERDW
jgi:hypothetical protein